MKFSLFLLFFSFSTLAAELCEPPKAFDISAIEILESEVLSALEGKKEWNAATNEQIENAFCSTKPKTNKEIQKYLKKNFKDKGVVDINGFTLKNQDPRLAESLLKLINKEASLRDKNEIRTDLSGEKFKDCKTVVCLSQKVFGENLGPKLLYMHQKFGMNGSHLVAKDARAWDEKELDAYIHGMEDLPSYILPMDKNKQCIHDKEENGNTMADASITFYSGLDKLSAPEKQYTVFHEISHYISGELEIDSNPEWLELSNWKVNYLKKLEIEKAMAKPIKKPSFDTSLNFKPLGSSSKISSGFSSGLTLGGSTTKPSYSNFGTMDKFNDQAIEIMIFHKAMESDKKDVIISEYGETNPAEDFAESMAAYRYNPLTLKKISPLKYEFIKKNVFGGQEFTSEKDCQNSQSEIHQYIQLAQAWNPKELKENFSKQDEEESFVNFQRKEYIDSLDISETEKENLKNILTHYGQ